MCNPVRLLFLARIRGHRMTGGSCTRGPQVQILIHFGMQSQPGIRTHGPMWPVRLDTVGGRP